MDYLILSFVTMFLSVAVLVFMVTQIHQKQISKTIFIALFCVFPGPIILAMVVSFLAYIKNRGRQVSFEAGCLIYNGKKFGHDSIWFVELVGPYVINVQMKGISGFRFVSDDMTRIRVIIDEIKKIKPDIQFKQHVMGKNAKH